MKLRTKYRRCGSNGWSFRQDAGDVAPIDEASDKVPEIWLRWIKLQTKCRRPGSNGWSFRHSDRHLAQKGWSFRQNAGELVPMDEASDKVQEIWLKWIKLQIKCWKSGCNGWSFRHSAGDLVQWMKLQKKCRRPGSNWWSFRQSLAPMD